MPNIPEGHIENMHPVYKRLRTMFGMVDFSEELVRRGRAGYYGLITYLDEKIGRFIDVLEETSQLENTVIVHTSDHGEMNGEHGMWRKSNMYEASSRVPLQIAWPGNLPQGLRISQNVSLVDLVATIIEWGNASSDIAPLDGNSLLPLINGDTESWKNEAFCEYLAHGVVRPVSMLKKGDYKLNISLGDPPELFNIAEDPNEFNDLSESSEHREILNTMRNRLLEIWENPEELERQVLKSQSERRFITAASGGRL